MDTKQTERGHKGRTQEEKTKQTTKKETTYMYVQ